LLRQLNKQAILQLPPNDWARRAEHRHRRDLAPRSQAEAAR
jgi:hypothetical protein